jgi:acetyltransferase-like isoleucine patch superfamily enzyme
MGDSKQVSLNASDDPLSFLTRIATKLYTVWLKTTYPFPEFGSGVSFHYSCDVARPASRHICVKDGVYAAPDVWLTVVHYPEEMDTKIVLGRSVKIGRRSTISAKNYVEIGDEVLFGPAVLIMDHNHEFGDPFLPILNQGVTDGGRIIVKKNCWLGYGCVIVCAKGELVIGENSVVGAHSVVTKSVPPRSIVAGNPAKVIKTYDLQENSWRRVIESDEECRA